MLQEAKWYVVHTYSGYENKVKVNLEKTIENRQLDQLIFDIQIPVEQIIEEKNGKKKVTLKKIFPGYVLIKMILNEESWYIVRNTRGVTGFVGPKPNEPVPLTNEEIKKMGIKEKVSKVDISVGENVTVASGPLENFVACIQEINWEKGTVKALVNMFGRETPVELEIDKLKKLD